MTTQNVPLTPTITASTNNIPKDSLDCGLKVLGWCRNERCQRLARLRYFLPIFLFAGLLQGAIETYFRISTKQTTTYHDYDPQLIDWLLISKNIFQALLAFIIAFWSQRYHPISWLGSSIIFQAIFCFFSIIPTLTHYNFDITSVKYDNFTSICKSSVLTNSNLEEEYTDYYTTKMIMLFLLQFGHALGYTALITIGLPYTDNNAMIEDAPAIFGAVFSVYAWGSLLGFIVTFIADVGYMNWWFGWAIFGPLLFITGTLITLFPRKLLRVVLKQAAQRIIDGNSSAPSRTFQYLEDVNFIPSLRRLLTNKILLLNLSGLTLIKTGIFNYDANDQNYLQSKFYFPTDENNGIMDEWTSRLLSYLLEPPVVGTCVLVTGLLISRLKPNARYLTIWNIISGSLIIVIFISYVFIDCSGSHSLVGIRKNVVTQPYCSRECICSTKDILFMPVCVEKSNQTYFSPCHAGCKNKISLNDVTLYENCTCGSNNNGYPSGSVLNRATQGACNMKECQVKWIVYQILSVIVAALYGTILICKIVLILRSVLDQDKPLALALELFISGIIVYVPGKFIYDTVQKNTCAFWSINYKKCLLQDPELYGNILNFVTITLIGIALILDIVVYIFSEDLDLFTRNPPYNEPFHFTPPLVNAPDQNTSENDNNDGQPPADERDNTAENTPILQTAEIHIPQQQQQQSQSSPPQRQLLLLPSHPRPISPSTSSESQASPHISSYRRQGAIPKALRIQTSETDF